MNKETIDAIIRYNKRASKEIKRLQQENKQLQERIDKTIEYIESFGISDNDLKGLGECPITINDLCNLLEILKGSEE